MWFRIGLMGAVLGSIFSATAKADVLKLVMEGQVDLVQGGGLLSGPLAGAQVGELVRAELEVELVTGPLVGTAIYNILPESLRIEVGSAVEAETIVGVSLVVGNDVAFPSFPQVDYLNTQFTLQQWNQHTLLLEDAGGAMLSSTELLVAAGNTVAVPHGSLVIDNQLTTGRVEMEILTLDVYPITPVGLTFCAPSVTNSTGSAAQLACVGHAAVHAHELGFVASSLPPGEFAMLVAGTAHGAIVTPLEPRVSFASVETSRDSTEAWCRWGRINSPTSP
ncbi:MAG: hypothetical protein R3F17_12935 [Planctomycetota bacterium]